MSINLPASRAPPPATLNPPARTRASDRRHRGSSPQSWPFAWPLRPESRARRPAVASAPPSTPVPAKHRQTILFRFRPGAFAGRKDAPGNERHQLTEKRRCRRVVEYGQIERLTGYITTLVTARHAPSQVRTQKHAPSRALRMAKPRNFSVISAAEDHLYYQSK
jgi:hypothetical protein